MADKGGASSDLFNGSGFGGFKPKFSAGGVNAAAGAVSDWYAAKGHDTKAIGDRMEAESYRKGALLADENAVYTGVSSEIQQAQADRGIFKTLGGMESDIAGAGFGESGTALDLLRDSAAQGSLAKNVLAYQGLITQDSYREQAATLRNQSDAAEMAAHAEGEAADGARISGGIKGIASIASMFI